MIFDESFKINVNKLNSDEKIITIARISHPSLNSNIAIASDSDPIIIDGVDYLSFPFVVKMQNQVEGELPKATMTIPNVAPQIVKWIDESMGARNGKIEISITRRSTQRIEYSVVFNIDTIKITLDEIVFTMSVQDNLTKPAIRWRYDNNHAIGIVGA